MESNKQLILKLGAVLIGALLLLTFFSNTIYSLNLPGITVGFPTGGVITRTHRSEGVVDFAGNVYMYAEVSGKITLSVKEGDVVNAGDSLFTLRSDMEDLQDRLLSETNCLEKLSIEIERTEGELVYRQKLLSEFGPEAERLTEVKPPDTDGFDYELARLAAEKENTEGEYHSALVLFEAGAVTREAVTTIETKLAALDMQYSRIEEQKEKALAEYERELEKVAGDDREKREAQLKAYEAQRQSMVKGLEDLRFQMDSYALDKNESCRTIDRLNEQINAGGMVTVKAEAGGVVRDIAVGVETGAYVDRNRQVMHIGVTSSDSTKYPYRTTVLFPEAIDFLSVGASIRLNIESSKQYGLNGVIEKLGYESGRVRADIAFDAAPLNGGEKVEAIAEMVSPSFETVLPNSAVRRDQDGYFILYVERVPNFMMGYSYYARKMQAFMITQDEQKTALVMYSELSGPVIINSDKPISSGDMVRLLNINELVGTR